jgi:hypothetical protein
MGVDDSGAGVRRVAVFRNQFLPISETFIHDELRCHERYRPTVFARKQVNADSFPGHEVCAVERLPEEPHPLASLVYALSARSTRLARRFAQGGFSILGGPLPGPLTAGWTSGIARDGDEPALRAQAALSPAARPRGSRCGCCCPIGPPATRAAR